MRLITILVATLAVPIPGAVQAATCHGHADCRACKNCKYCKRCAKQSGACGVCQPTPKPKQAVKW